MISKRVKYAVLNYFLKDVSVKINNYGQYGAVLSPRQMFFNRQEGTKSGHKQLLNHKLLVPYRMENFHVNPTNTKVIKSLLAF